MPYLGNEETLVELPAIEYLKNLGYEFNHGDNLTPENGERESLNEVILHDRLIQSLKRINPWINESNLNKAVRFISRADNLGASLLEINEKIYDAIVNLKYSLDQDLDGSGKKKFHTVKFIDWDNIDNNEFLVTRQFVIQGPTEKIIPDIIIFINGIPVVVLECKSPFLEKSKNENIGKYEAFEQLRRYMDQRGSQKGEGAPRLFHTNFFTAILNKYHAYVGTISSGYGNYLEWKDPYPFKLKDIPDVDNNGQNVFLQGVLEQRNLLDIIQNFILFDSDEKGKTKKICRYQQFRAVNKSISNLINGKDALTRGGVIWHTQGSGKSLTMVYLARKIRRIPRLRDATIVVVTDRIDLDDQIYNTFVNTLSTITTPVRAETIAQMKELLSGARAQIIMTTIQKFQSEKEEKAVFNDGKQETALYFEKPFEVLTTKSNVIVLADEAHRSQYKNTAKNMRDALPNAVFIGFTGTPIDKKDKSTPKRFGGYIDKYTIQQAVEDGATVPIIYEGRRPDLQIKGETLEELFDQAFENRSEEEREAIKQKYVNKKAVVEADDRIDTIAKDLLKHYKEQVYPNGFKAQIVCVSREACVKYYNAINKHMEDIMDEPLEVQIIYSGSLNDPPHLKEHNTTKAQQKNLINRFKQPLEEDKLTFIIVKDMLLTGFDAPIEQVMYLDCPLKEHNLLQAIARVNRTHGDKKCGYIVDYYGVSNFLEEALAIFDKDELGEPMQSTDAIYKEMLSYREAVMAIFNGTDKNDLDALINKIKPEDKRAEFELAYKRYASAMEQILPSHVPTNNINDLRWLSYIRAAAKARFEPGKHLDISDCGQKVKQIISEHLQSLGVRQWITPMSLFDNDFRDKLNTLKTDEAKASAMEHSVREMIRVKLDDNPVYYTSLLDKLQQILEETRNDWVERKNKLEKFLETDVQKGETEQAKALGLSKEEYSFFEIVRKQLSSTNDTESELVAEDGVEYITTDVVELAKEIATDVAQIVKENYVIDWTINPTKSNQIERAIYMKLNIKYHSKLSIEDRKSLVQPLLNLAKKHFATIN
ncbi:Type I restriction-modification system, restriction subunit R [Candidatus Syntrophocurvum alkaliphilum]|uniref:Type I restriction enzyme endonuclease subunit n=1 Tax=Candidatus Syntrophocurvum alkaliphilum TaxID=2293317 RepID=A0A6I6DCL5_9FIRM|nr:type I restriction endonuclease subunit R [Candidatus Syntrophocurvum alkaliphilum]QGU00342.1 Type I restriction-modification system, restriction subunit R [Candidatus Syntrophocurvum alkaliphilum]